MLTCTSSIPDKSVCTFSMADTIIGNGLRLTCTSSIPSTRLSFINARHYYQFLIVIIIIVTIIVISISRLRSNQQVSNNPVSP